MPFLDVLITRSSNGFKTLVYHKFTFSAVYSNFNSFISEEYKVGLIFTYYFNFSQLFWTICHLKEILKKNAFPIKLIDSCIKNVLKRRLAEKPVTLTVQKKDLVIASPFLGKLPLDLKTGLKNSFRVGKHSGVSPSPGKKSKSKKATAVKDHMFFCDHICIH